MAPAAWADPSLRFTDVTAKAGIDFAETIGDGEMTNIVESAGVGCGFLDYDGDGWLDIYFANGHWRPDLSDPELPLAERKTLARATDRLYHNRGDGTFEDVSVKAGITEPAYGMGVVTADYDDDGDTDIYVTNFGPNQLFRNNGDGTFTDVAKASGVDDPRFSVGAVFADFNQDGRLDLFVANYIVYDPHYRMFYAPDGFPGPLAYEGEVDALYLGGAGGTFFDATSALGVGVKPAGRGMGVAALDFDADGRIDIFVANDAMENFLWHNRPDGTFENEGLKLGVAFGQNGDATAAMGVDVADYDGDGRVDMVVPDMTFSCLYRNSGDGAFQDDAARGGLAAAMGQYTGWSGLFADFDLDGALDLYISTGDVHHLEPQEDVVLVGTGEGRFEDVSGQSGDWFGTEHVGRGAAVGDFDNDGDMDVLVTNLNDRPALLRNDTPRRGRHWLRVRLMGKSGNRDAIGAVVEVKTSARRMLRYRLAAGGYLSQHDSRLHFGLGEATVVERLEVRWPDGSRQFLQDVKADQEVSVVKGKADTSSARP